MKITIALGALMAKKRLSLTELSDRTGIDISQLTLLRNGEAEAVRFSTLSALAKAFDCQPSELLEDAGSVKYHTADKASD
jgi:putative transcriptional regulator